MPRPDTVNVTPYPTKTYMVNGKKRSIKHTIKKVNLTNNVLQQLKKRELYVVNEHDEMTPADYTQYFLKFYNNQNRERAAFKVLNESIRQQREAVADEHQKFVAKALQNASNRKAFQENAIQKIRNSQTYKNDPKAGENKIKAMQKKWNNELNGGGRNKTYKKK